MKNVNFIPEELTMLAFKNTKSNISEYDLSHIVDIHEKIESLKVEFELELNVKVGFNIKKKSSKVDVCLNIDKRLENSEIITANAELIFSFIYHIENFEDLYSIKKENDTESYVIEKVLRDNLAAISFSTVRGILLNQLSNGEFEGFILPIIDITKHINKEEN